MLHRYAEWTRRRGRTAQCSPAIGALAALLIFGAVIYVYRQVILTTIITAVLAAVGVTLIVGSVAFIISTLRWYRKRTKLMAASPDGSTALVTATDDADASAIGAEADLLASAGTELVFDKEGNLHAKTGRTS
jgi:hypothetical protein